MIKENLDKLKAKINSFQINTVVKIKADKLKIINGNLYVYLNYYNLIKVYDCETFKEISKTIRFMFMVLRAQPER